MIRFPPSFADSAPGPTDSGLPRPTDPAPPGSPTATAPDTLAAPVPDPFDDADALEELGDEIATLAAHIAAATHRMFLLIADFDRRRGWELGGHRSCAHWLAVRTGMKLNAAREKVRTARVLVGLPETGASMGRGELSFSAVRALTRVATPENESDLLDFARGATTAEIERMVRSHRRSGPKGEAELERERHESRTLSVFPDHNGMYVVRGRLTPELGALLMRAVEAASDALYREDRGMPDVAGALSEEESRRQAARRRADALGLLAERALAAGFSDDDAPVSGSRAERYQVVIHGDVELLTGDADASTCGEPAPTPDESVLNAGQSPDRAELDDGIHVTAVTFRRICCDAAVVPMIHGRRDDRESVPGPSTEADPGGPSPGAPRSFLRDRPILSVGRRTRIIPPALRRALDARDRGCRFPDHSPAASGARRLRFTDAHHVEHWADGGETSLANCLLLCRHHHRLVHEGGWRVSWWGEGRPVFFDPRGGAHYDGRWSPPEPAHGSTASRDRLEQADGSTASRGRPEGHLASALLEQHRIRGIGPDGWTLGASWEREVDIPDEIYFRALEAIG